MTETAPAKPEPVSRGLLKCPDDGGDLLEFAPSLQFYRHFECVECTKVFSFFGGVLRLGKRGPASNAAQGLHP